MRHAFDFAHEIAVMVESPSYYSPSPASAFPIPLLPSTPPLRLTPPQGDVGRYHDVALLNFCSLSFWMPFVPLTKPVSSTWFEAVRQCIKVQAVALDARPTTNLWVEHGDAAFTLGSGKILNCTPLLRTECVVFVYPPLRGVVGYAKECSPATESTLALVSPLADEPVRVGFLVPHPIR